MCLLRYLQWLPIALVGLGILKIVSTYVIAIANQYVDPVFPYISTVASGYPQRVTFMLFAFLLSVLLIACVYARYVFVKRVTYKRRPDAEECDPSRLPVSHISEAIVSDSCVGFTATGASSVEVVVANTKCPPTQTCKHDAFAKSSWYRLNTVTFVTGVVLTICYAGVCGVPENVKSLRLTHMLLAISLFFSGTAYVIFDCTLSYWLLKLAALSKINRHPELHIRHWVVASRTTVILRLAIVVFTLILSVAGLPLLYFADDPLEHYYGDITKPKLRCGELELAPINATAGSSSIYPQPMSPCNYEVHVIIHIITAIIEWLVTVAIMVYFLTFYSEFKNFRPVINIESKKHQKLQRQTTGGEHSSTLTGNFSQTTQATSLPSPLYSPSLSQFSYDSSENSPMINIVCAETKS